MTRMSQIRFSIVAAMLVSTLWAQNDADIRGNRGQQNPSELVLEVPKKVDAVYPAEALRDKVQGQVIIKVLIADTGEVENAEIVSGNPVLAVSALAAAKEWIFKTWRYKKYIPVSAWATIAFDFQLPDEQSKTSSTPTDGPVVTGKVVESGELPNTLTTKPLHVGAGMTQGLVIHKVQPVYPPGARRARVQGSVVLQAIISKEGTIENLRVLSGDSMLVDAAIEAVRQWRYRPYVVNGEPVKVDTQIVVNFTLSQR